MKSILTLTLVLGIFSTLAFSEEYSEKTHKEFPIGNQKSIDLPKTKQSNIAYCYHRLLGGAISIKITFSHEDIKAMQVQIKRWQMRKGGTIQSWNTTLTRKSKGKEITYTGSRLVGKQEEEFAPVMDNLETAFYAADKIALLAVAQRRLGLKTVPKKAKRAIVILLALDEEDYVSVDIPDDKPKKNQTSKDSGAVKKQSTYCQPQNDAFDCSRQHDISHSLPSTENEKDAMQRWVETMGDVQPMHYPMPCDHHKATETLNTVKEIWTGSSREVSEDQTNQMLFSGDLQKVYKLLEASPEEFLDPSK